MRKRFDFDKFVKSAESGGFPVILGWSAQERTWCIAMPCNGKTVVGKGTTPADATEDLVVKLRLQEGGKS